MSSGPIAPSKCTVEEFYALPETEPASELIDGAVRQKSMPNHQHAWLQGVACARINAQGMPARRFVAFPEARERFGDEVMVPDISIVRWDRIIWERPGRPAKRQGIPPDIACEIRSDDQSLPQLSDCCRKFLRAGVRLALLLLPDDDAIIRFAPDGGERRLTGDASLDCEDAVPGLRLRVTDIFNPLGAT